MNDSYEYFKWENKSELMAQDKSWSLINLDYELESFQEWNDSPVQSFVGAENLLNHFKKKKSYIMVGNKRQLLVAQEQSFDNRFCRL